MEGLGHSLGVHALEDNDRDTFVFIASSVRERNPNVQGLRCKFPCARAWWPRARTSETALLGMAEPNPEDFVLGWSALLQLRRRVAGTRQRNALRVSPTVRWPLLADGRPAGRGATLEALSVRNGLRQGRAQTGRSEHRRDTKAQPGARVHAHASGIGGIRRYATTLSMATHCIRALGA